MRYFPVFILLLLCLSGCSNNSTGPKEEVSEVYFSPDSISLQKDQWSSISLILNIDEPVFGLTMHIKYPYGLIDFDETEDVQLGGFFGNGVITFIERRVDYLYITLSLTQGQGMVKGSGQLGALTFQGRTQGEGKITVVPEELHFYDSAGEEIVFSNLTIRDSRIAVM